MSDPHEIVGIEAERCLIGSAMAATSTADKLLRELPEEAFSQPVHRVIWRAVTVLRGESKDTNPLSVLEELGRTGEVRKLGDPTYLSLCVSAALDNPGDPMWYLRIVQRGAHQRRLNLLAHQLLRTSDVADDEQRLANVREIHEHLGNGVLTPFATSTPPTLRSQAVDTHGLDSIPNPVPIISSVLYADSLAWLIGRPGHMKTFVALDMAGCVARGIPWQGFSVNSGSVLYLITEGVSGIRARVRSWEAAYETRMEGVTFLPVAVQAATGAQWTELCGFASDLRPSLIVLDTQSRLTVGLEENSAKDMGLFVEKLEHLRQASRACVLTIHHTPRNADHMRGSTAMEGAAQTIIKVSKEDATITLTNSVEQGGKQKDGEPFPTVYLRVVPRDASITLVQTGPSGEDHSLSDACQSMLRLWSARHQTDLVSISALVDSEVCNKSTFYKYKHALLRAGVIAAEGNGNRIKYRLVRTLDQDRSAQSQDQSASGPVALESPLGSQSAQSALPLGEQTDRLNETPPFKFIDNGRSLASDGPLEVGPTPCRTCGEPIDRFLTDAGAEYHVGCEPNE